MKRDTTFVCCCCRSDADSRMSLFNTSSDPTTEEAGREAAEEAWSAICEFWLEGILLPLISIPGILGWLIPGACRGVVFGSAIAPNLSAPGVALLALQMNSFPRFFVMN